MQALIKKGTRSNPIWGWIRFQPKSWVIVESRDKMFPFTDTTTIENIDGLTNNQATIEGYDLVNISVVII